MHHAYLSLGSNIVPERHMPAAVRELQKLGTVVKISTVWETQPVGRTPLDDVRGQPVYWNAAVLLATEHSASVLKLQHLQELERRLGRVRNPADKCAPRTIDVDIALFNDDVLAIEHRRIPDPDICSRPFLAIPLAELDGNYVHPQLGRTLKEIADDFGPSPPGMQALTNVNLLKLSQANADDVPR